MEMPTSFKPGIVGAALGAVGMTIVGFAWAGWVTGSTAEKMARDRGQSEVVAALVPICLANSKIDPNAKTILDEIEAASSYQRRDMVVKAGWATMPGSEEANRDVARACGEALSEAF